jgi:hypothetical protein
MKEKIKDNIGNPEELERLYHEDRKSFESGFEEVQSETGNSELTRFWRIRLNYEKAPDRIKKFLWSDILILVVSCLISGFLIKIPNLFAFDLHKFLFYEKNAGIIFFLGLTIYTIWTGRVFEKKRLLITILIFLIPAVYINLLPSNRNSDSVNLACIHLALLMWCAYGLVYTGFDLRDKSKRIEFIRHNGDLAIMGALILIAGGILTGITIGLFSAINIQIQKFYMDNVVIVGLVAAPIVTKYILENYITLANRIAPVIANIFSPLVLITLVIYLIAILVSGKDPYNNRDFLLIFNIMLLGVMCIIVFSISETSVKRKQKLSELLLFILSILTLIIDVIALSAIFYRLGEFGITPNRMAVLGSNILILGNLVLIIIDLYKINFKKSEIEKVGLTISKYLPVYIIWLLIVIFGFPFFFGMR